MINNVSLDVNNFIKNADIEKISIGCSDTEVFKITKESKEFYLKIGKNDTLIREFTALNWLKGKLSVPEIVLFDENNNYEYLITEALPGEMICSDYYENNPEEALKIIKEAFDNLYSIDISTCPFNVSIDYKLNLVQKNVENNLIKKENISKKVLDKYKSPENILNYLKNNKFKEELCFSHGDISLPNIFALNYKFSGFIDVGECGIADKWFDLAICEKSIKRNFGDKYVSKFYETLNIIPDRKKIEYYLLMMELYL